jgi:hypothetical protein
MGAYPRSTCGVAVEAEASSSGRSHWFCSGPCTALHPHPSDRWQHDRSSLPTSSDPLQMVMGVHSIRSRAKCGSAIPQSWVDEVRLGHESGSCTRSPIPHILLLDEHVGGRELRRGGDSSVPSGSHTDYADAQIVLLVTGCESVSGSSSSRVMQSYVRLPLTVWR